MEKVYKYPVTNSEWSIGLPFVAIIIVVGAIVLVRGLNAEKLPDQALGVGLGLLFLVSAISWVIFICLRHAGRIRVVVTTQALIVQNGLITKSISWSDIVEFGTYKVTGRAPVRVYYVRTRECPDRQIRICHEFLDDIEGLIDEVFQKAINARFLRIENIALIPFTKNLRIVAWERNTEATR